MNFQAISWETQDTKCEVREFLGNLWTPQRQDVSLAIMKPLPNAQGRDLYRTIDVLSVYVCGRTLEGELVHCELRGFRPYFYVHIQNVPEISLDNCIEEFTNDFRFRYCEIRKVTKIPFVGFHEHTEHFLRVECPSSRIYYQAKMYFRNANVPHLLTYESVCDPLIQFWIACKIHPMTWMSTSGDKMWLTDSELQFQSDNPQPSSFKCVHYDLECFSSVAWNTGKNQMPSPELNDDVIIGIGAVVTMTNSPDILEKVYIGIGPINIEEITNSDSTANVIVCADEQEMLSQFCRWMSRVDPDIVNAFNNFGFDDRYLFKRLEKYEMLENFPTRLPGRDITLRQKHFASNAIQFDGDYIHHPLRIYFDLLLFARREFKTEMKKFTLENVSQVLMGKGKHDVSAHEIFQAWSTKDVTMLTKVAAYCIQDCCLVAEIMAYKQVYSTIFSRAELFLCDPRDLLIKGQQQIVFNLIYNQVRTHTNFTIPDSADDAIDDFLDEPGSDSDSDDDEYERVKQKFKGATVLEPKAGAYMCPISGLDFASLYPSIMVAYNLCHSTKLLTPESGESVAPENKYTTPLSGGRETTFVQKDHRRGVLPQILLNLWGMRKKLKKDMAKAKDAGQKNMVAIFNAKQLAVKVAMNSIYGFCGADNGKLPMKDIAETVTANGRMLIDRSKNYVESWYPCEVVYGDSVTGDTPLLLRNADTGEICIQCIQDLSDNFVEYPNFRPHDTSGHSKEQANIRNMQVWSAHGWADIVRVIRHKTTKRMFRVCTPTGCVDVTEDHSLLDPNLNKLKPTDVTTGTLLKHSFPTFRNVDVFDHDDDCKRAAHMTGRLVQYAGFSLDQAEGTMILNAPRYAQEEFLKAAGVCLESPEVYTKNKQNAHFFYTLFNMMGFSNVSVNNYKVFVSESFVHNSDAVTSIEEIASTTDDYVYDIETSDGTFQAGIGQMIVKNTDSIYVRFSLEELPANLQNPTNPDDIREMMRWVFARSQEAADRITANYIHPIELEFEKVMFPFILFKKKRYTYVEYEKFDEVITEDHINMKGIAPTRRDYAPFVKRVCCHMLNMILLDRNINGAFEYIEYEMMRLLRNDYDVSELVVSRSISKRPENYANQNTPHVALALKIEERSGVATRLGERIQFVFKKGRGEQRDLVEEPHLVQQNEVDGAYYYFHQIHHTLEEILGTIDQRRWLALDMKLSNRARGLVEISQFFGASNVEIRIPQVQKRTKKETNVSGGMKKIESFFGVMKK